MFRNRSALLFMLLLLTVASCRKDKVEDSSATRDDFLGLWQCDEYDQNQQLIRTFQVEIFAHGSDVNKVFIDNFNLLGQGFQAEGVTNNTSIDIPQQVIGSVSVSGSGYITNKHTTLELSYNVDDQSGQPENITATLTKL